jgi:endoglucanase
MRARLAVLLLLTAAGGGCRQGAWETWNSYASHFIDANGRVIDRSAGDRTTSEGQGYAMFFALADNDRARFDLLLAWTQANLAGGNLGTHLPGWLWGKAPTGEWKLLDANPASDADCWMAYSLVEAGRLWKEPTYLLLGRQIMAMVAKQEVAELPGFGSMLMPGITSYFQHGAVYTLNPSYLPLFVFDRFAEIDPAGPWGAIAMNTPLLLRQSAEKGFAMDWVNYEAGKGFTPAPSQSSAPPPPAQNPVQGQTGAAAQRPDAPKGAAPNGATAQAAAAAQQGSSIAKPASGSYDAIRVYLWAGMMDKSGQRRAELLDSLYGMGRYLDHHGAPPETISAEGIPGSADGPVGFSAAVLPYLWAQSDHARAAAQQRVRIGAQLNAATGLYGKDPVYYDQNLVLFARGFLDDRFRFGSRGELRVEWTR